MLRNSQGGLTNPDKLSDYLGPEYQKAFSAAQQQSACQGDVAAADKGKAIRVRLKPGSAARWLN
jgi:hypothetical protein